MTSTKGRAYLELPAVAPFDPAFVVNPDSFAALSRLSFHVATQRMTFVSKSYT